MLSIRNALCHLHICYSLQMFAMHVFFYIYNIECPWNPPTQYYASSFNNTCQTQCPPGWYGFDGNKTCVQNCPATPNMTFYDTINKKCVKICPTGYFSYIGAIVASNQTCLASIIFYKLSMPNRYICIINKSAMCGYMPFKYLL
jgi:hypothetical protein